MCRTGSRAVWQGLSLAMLGRAKRGMARRLHRPASLGRHLAWKACSNVRLSVKPYGPLLVTNGVIS
jgi:hypothetical protein